MAENPSFDPSNPPNRSLLVPMTDERLRKMLEEAREDGYRDGWDEGYEAGQLNAEGNGE